MVPALLLMTRRCLGRAGLLAWVRSGVPVVLLACAPEATQLEVSFAEVELDQHHYTDRPIQVRARVQSRRSAGGLYAEWKSDWDGRLIELPGAIPVGDVEVGGRTMLSEGTHTITLLVTDARGASGGADALFVVGGASQDPSCTIVAPDGGTSAPPGSSLVFEGVVADSDVRPEELEVTWTSSRDGLLGKSQPGSDGRIWLELDHLGPGAHTVTLEAVDDVGARCQDEVEIEVEVAPELTIRSPEVDSVWFSGTAVLFEAVLVDEDDPASVLSQHWSLVGGETLTPAGAVPENGRVRFWRADLPPGTHTLRVDVADPEGGTASSSVRFRIDAPPDAAAVRIDEATSDRDLVAVVVADAVDPEGDPITYSWGWSVDGVVDPGLVGDRVPAARTVRGEEWRVTLTAADPWGEGEPAHAAVVVLNAPPVVRTAVVLPDEASASDSLSCQPGLVEDSDGDEIRGFIVRWTVDGADVEGGTSLTGGFGRDDRVACHLAAFDDDLGPEVASDPVTIVNAAPLLTGVSLAPRRPFVGDPIRCRYGFVDADGDPDHSSVSWYVDDAYVGDGILLPVEVGQGQTVACTVDAFDGTTLGTSSSSPDAMVDPRPEAGNVLILLADDLGIDKIQAYGRVEETPRTPRIDSLVEDGLLFLEAHGSPVGSPSRASLLTGMAPRQTGIGAALHHATPWPLQDDWITLPEWLDERSGLYSHALAGKWGLASSVRHGLDSPNANGFEMFVGSVYGLDRESTQDGLPQDYHDWERVVDGSWERSRVYLTTDNADVAVDSIESLVEPWLLVVSFTAPRAPYHWPPDDLWTQEPLGGDPLHQQYGAMVESLDSELGRVLDGMSAGVRGRTTVIFTSDNGTPREGVSIPGSERQGKGTGFDLGSHVPLVVASRWVDQPGSTTETLVHLTDVFATVAELAGVPLGADDLEGRDSVSLVPWMRDPDVPSARDAVVVEQFSPEGPSTDKDSYLVAVTDGRYRMIRTLGEGDALYDLDASWPEGDNLLDGVLDAEQEAVYSRLLDAVPTDLLWPE